MVISGSPGLFAEPDHGFPPGLRVSPGAVQGVFAGMCKFVQKDLDELGLTGGLEPWMKMYPLCICVASPISQAKVPFDWNLPNAGEPRLEADCPLDAVGEALVCGDLADGAD